MDNYSVFAVDAFGMSDVEAAELSTWAAWVRPISAIGVGLFADRISSTKATAVSFVILILSYLSFLVLEPVPGKLTVLYLTIFFSAVAIYGLRGVYFAIMEEVDVPRHVTGTAVGIISLVGYTPDIFIMPIAGWLIDRSPGATGHQHFYGVLMLFSLIGLIAVLPPKKTGTDAENGGVGSVSAKKIIVVGGGIFGATAALSLAQRGESVTLLDAGIIPSHRLRRPISVNSFAQTTGTTVFIPNL